jgi:hypothetical protein
LEAEMGTESHVRFAAKIWLHLAYRESRVFRLRFGERSFRVLTVAATLTSARALKRVTEGQNGRRVFWLGCRANVTPERVAAPSWLIAGMPGIKGGLLRQPWRGFASKW